MGTLRFALLCVGIFALAFIGMSWGQKGFPVIAMRAEPLKPDARIPTFEESVKKGMRKDWEDSKTSQSDGDKERDTLRVALLQASIGYKLSPCDATMKKNLVEALTNYTKAWKAMAFCEGGVDGCPASSDERLDAAAAAFKSPADARVKQALHEAIDQGGLSKDDFPSPIRNNVFMWTGMPFGEPEAACLAARKAEAHR
jgi:hypothetical protein